MFSFLYLNSSLLMTVSWYLTVVLICISLMITDIKHLFMWILDICMYCVEKYPLKSFAYFWIRYSIFLLLSFRISLYILDVYIRLKFSNIFSDTVGYFFILMIVLLVYTCFNIMKSNMFIFLLCYLHLWSLIQEIIAKFNDMKFLSQVSFWEMYDFRCYM